jgi:hypothetical protein
MPTFNIILYRSVGALIFSDLRQIATRGGPGRVAPAARTGIIARRVDPYTILCGALLDSFGLRKGRTN